MFISQKSQYGLRAIFELARRAGKGPVKIGDIAESQAIPPRFLEVILSQLKQAGYVESRRGQDGGYFLAREPHALTVGAVLQFIQGPIAPVGCTLETSRGDCPLESCVFLPMWRRVQGSIQEVLDGTTFQDLLDQEKAMKGRYVPDFAI